MGEKASSLGSGGWVVFTQAEEAQRDPLMIFVQVCVLAAMFAEVGGLCKLWSLLRDNLLLTLQRVKNQV